jgi:uncharacterized protein YegP (UPF0339 family)
MTQLFVPLSTSATGSVITIAALEIVAATIGFITAWVYARSINTPVIKSLEADNVTLKKQVATLRNELVSLNEVNNKFTARIGNLKGEIAEKDKEIKDLPSETTLATDSINIGKYVISKAKNDENYFNLKATNGQTILTSQMYSSESACFNGIESVRSNCSDDIKYERKQSINNKPYFVLKAANGQVIGNSEMYESGAGMENGIASVKKNGISTTVFEK